MYSISTVHYKMSISSDYTQLIQILCSFPIQLFFQNPLFAPFIATLQTSFPAVSGSRLSFSVLPLHDASPSLLSPLTTLLSPLPDSLPTHFHEALDASARFLTRSLPRTLPLSSTLLLPVSVFLLTALLSTPRSPLIILKSLSFLSRDTSKKCPNPLPICLELATDRRKSFTKRYKSERRGNWKQ
jgi:hypothetical protein